ncbi:MAG: hypothetical protein ACRYGR_10605 [Janthinobacterium lividum]
MANVNIAQHEQLLKSLEHALKEIGDLHKHMHNILDVMQINVHQACHDLNVSWSQVVNLFVIVDQLRSTHLESKVTKRYFDEDVQQMMANGERT